MKGDYRLAGWTDDATSAMDNGRAYFEWWDAVKTGVLLLGIVAVVMAYRENEASKR